MAEFDWSLVRKVIEDHEGEIPEDWYFVLPVGTNSTIVGMIEELVDCEVVVGEVAVPTLTATKPVKPVSDIDPGPMVLADFMEAMLGIKPTPADLQRIRKIVKDEGTTWIPKSSHNHGIAQDLWPSQNYNYEPKPSMGQTVYNVGDDQTYVYDGAEWVPDPGRFGVTGPVPTTNRVLIIAGDHRQIKDVEKGLLDHRITWMAVDHPETLRGMQWKPGMDLIFTGTWGMRKDLTEILLGLVSIGCDPHTILTAMVSTPRQCQCPRCTNGAVTWKNDLRFIPETPLDMEKLKAEMEKISQNRMRVGKKRSQRSF